MPVLEALGAFVRDSTTRHDVEERGNGNEAQRQLTFKLRSRSSDGAIGRHRRSSELQQGFPRL